MQAKKSLGQNFLMHFQTAERIAVAAKLPPSATVLEIGPGTGMLTRALLSRAERVIALEADPELVSHLEEGFSTEILNGKLSLFHKDVRTFDSSTISGEYHLVANIPYYITGEIFRQFLAARHKPSSMTVLVQKEVAERIARQKGKSPKESLLSLSIKAYGTPSYCFTVPRGAFEPAPKVDSAVLTIQGISGASFGTAAEEERFFEALRAGFAHKRKLLARNLMERFTTASVEAGFTAANVPLQARAEDLSLAPWITLARVLERASEDAR
jgi:16S rRNA (adenine1518-N6/adenine1519-N6)-dimethyltransferase